MVEMINKYETIFVIDASLEEEKITALVDKFKTLIAEEGTIVSVEEWGKRKLAYPINFKTEGYYVFVTFDSVGTLPKELERVFSITDGILRSIVVKRDEKIGKITKGE